jgi:IS30 family transposase
VSLETGMKVYFCDPGQRPSNENTNGPLRQCFPKETDLFQHPSGSTTCRARVEGPPRKSVNDRSPVEVFAEEEAPLDPLPCYDRQKTPALARPFSGGVDTL